MITFETVNKQNTNETQQTSTMNLLHIMYALCLILIEVIWNIHQIEHDTY